MPKKYVKVPVTSSALELKICYYGFPYYEGHLTEVLMDFDIIAMKVVGQTIYSCYSIKLNNL